MDRDFPCTLKANKILQRGHIQKILMPFFTFTKLNIKCQSLKKKKGEQTERPYCFKMKGSQFQSKKERSFLGGEETEITWDKKKKKRKRFPCWY